MNTVTRAWQAAMSALKEARKLAERGGDIKTMCDLLRHAREMIDVIEAEFSAGQAIAADPDVIRMVADQLRARVDATAALVPLR
jgi:hypothetical protein